MGEHDQHTAEHYRQDENCDDKAEVLAEGHYRVATEHETCDDGDQAEDEKNSEPDARNFLLAEVLRQTGSSWSAKISLAPIHEWRAGSHHAPVAAQGSRGAALGGERLPRPRCVVGHGGSRECFTNRRVDARKYGLSRVCLVKRMSLKWRGESPKFAIVLNRGPVVGLCHAGRVRFAARHVGNTAESRIGCGALARPLGANSRLMHRRNARQGSSISWSQSLSQRGFGGHGREGPAEGPVGA